VVERPRQKLAQAMTAGGAQTDYRFRDSDLAVYGEYELQRLEEVLRLGREEPMANVAEAICAKIGWSTPQGGRLSPSSMPITPSCARGWKGDAYGTSQGRQEQLIPILHQSDASLHLRRGADAL
jgi:hypothetical protein